MQEQPRRPKKKAERDRREQTQTVIRDRGGISLSLIKALIYMALVLTVSGFIGVTGIRWGNDIFAFVKVGHRFFYHIRIKLQLLVSLLFFLSPLFLLSCLFFFL